MTTDHSMYGGAVMGYRIEYGQTEKMEYFNERLFIKNKKTVACAAAIMIAVLAFFFILGAKSMRSFLLPDDPVVTQQALETFAAQVRAGESFGDAAAAFCQNVIAGADISE